MKKKNYYLVFMLSMIGLITIGSCSLLESDPCEDVSCENGGTCDEGICDCPFGFLGDNCEVIDTSQIQALLESGTTPKTLFDGGVSLEQLYGKTYEDGLIFYLNTDDGTGMVAAKSDQNMGNKAIWGCEGNDIPGLNNVLTVATDPETEVGTKIGDGATNTAAILNGCNSNDEIAAKLCRDIGSEWFLPSRGELKLMFTNLHDNGHGRFKTEVYFSSTEFNESRAWAVAFFSSVGEQSSLPKNSFWYVRAARAF